MTSEEAIINKVQRWLKEEELQFNRIEESDPNNISFWPSHGLKIHANTTKERVTISR